MIDPLYDALVDGVQLDDLAIPTQVHCLTLIPSSIALAGAEVELTPLEPREWRLAGPSIPSATQYDFILVDCPPSLGLLTLNALTAADSVLIPIQSEYFALEGLGQLLPRPVRHAAPEPATRDRGRRADHVRRAHPPLPQVGDEVRRHFDDRVYAGRSAVDPALRGARATAADPSLRPGLPGADAYRDRAAEIRLARRTTRQPPRPPAAPVPVLG